MLNWQKLEAGAIPEQLAVEPGPDRNKANWASQTHNPTPFLTKLSLFSWGVWVRVCRGNHPLCHLWALPLSPPQLAGMVEALGGHCPLRQGLSDQEGGTAAAWLCSASPHHAPHPSDTGHKPRPSHRDAFGVCWLHYTRVKESYTGTSPAVSFI